MNQKNKSLTNDSIIGKSEKKQTDKTNANKLVPSVDYKSNSNRKTVALRVSLICFACLAFIGIIVGIVFLSLTPAPEDWSKLNNWVDGLNNGNAVTNQIKNEVVELPDGILHSDIVYIDTNYMVVCDNEKEVIYKRASVVDDYVCFSEFTFGGAQITYTKVDAITGDWVLVKNEVTEKSYFVSLENCSVVLEANGYTNLTLKNDILFLIGEDENYNAIAIGYSQEKSEIVLTVGDDEKAWWVEFNADNIVVKGENFVDIYSYELEESHLKELFREKTETFERVNDDYVAGEDEVVFNDGDGLIKLTAYSKKVVASSNFILVEKRVPTADPTKANIKEEMWNEDIGEWAPVYYIVTHEITDLNGNFVRRLETKGAYSYYAGISQIPGYYVLSCKPFKAFDENGYERADVDSADYTASVFDGDFNIIFSYNWDNDGDIVYSNYDYFVTSNGHSSGVLDKYGNKTGIIDTETYTVSTVGVFNGLFVVENNSRYGISDMQGNVIASASFAEISPIIDGYAVGYMTGYYYLIDLHKKTMKYIPDYCEDFHKYTMLGLGLYMTEGEDGKVLHSANGDAIFDKISSYSLVDPTLENMIVSVILKTEGDIHAVSAVAIDKSFFEKNFEYYTPYEADEFEPSVTEYSSLVFDDVLSFNSEEWVRLQNPEEEESAPDDEPDIAGSVSASDGEDYSASTGINAEFDAVNTDATSEFNSYINSYSSKLGEWWNKDKLSDHVGAIVWEENLNYAIQQVPLMPYFHLFNYSYDGQIKTSSNGVTDFFTYKYQKYFGINGYETKLNSKCFGYQTINNSSYYAEGQPLEYFGSPANLKKFIPNCDYSTGLLTNWGSNMMNDYMNFYVDGVVIFVSKPYIMVFTRIYAQWKDSVDGNYNWEHPVYAFGDYEKYYNYTYSVSIGVLNGYTVNDLYIGGYESGQWSDLPDTSSAAHCRASLNDLKYQYVSINASSGVIGQWYQRTLVPVVSYLPGVDNCVWFSWDGNGAPVKGGSDDCHCGLVVGEANEGWRATVMHGQKTSDGDYFAYNHGSTQNYSSRGDVQINYSDGSDYRGVYYIRSFSLDDALQMSPFCGVNSDVPYYGLEPVPDCDISMSQEGQNFYGTTVAFMYLRLGISEARVGEAKWFDRQNQNDKTGCHDETVEGLYYTASYSNSAGKITIRPRKGFYVSEVSMTVNEKTVSKATAKSDANGLYYEMTGVQNRNGLNNLKVTVTPISYSISVYKKVSINGVISDVSSNEFIDMKVYVPTLSDSGRMIVGDTNNIGTFLYGYNYNNTTANMKLPEFSINYKYKLVTSYKGVIYVDSADKLSSVYSNDVVTGSNFDRLYHATGKLADTSWFTGADFLGASLGTQKSLCKTVYAVYNIAKYNVSFTDEVKTSNYENAPDLTSGEKAIGMRVKKSDGTWELFTFDDNSSTGIGSNALTSLLYFNLPATAGFFDALKNHAQSMLSNYDEGTNKYRFLDLISKTSEFPVFVSSGHEMNKSAPQYTLRVSYTTTSNKSETDTSDFASKTDSLDIAVFDYGINRVDANKNIYVYVAGVYSPREFEVHFEDGLDLETLSGKTAYNLSVTNGYDVKFNSTSLDLTGSNKVRWGDTFSLPRLFAATKTYSAAVGNTFSDVMRLRKWQLEDETIEITADATCTLGGETFNSSVIGSLAFDPNLDNVITLKAVWDDVDNTSFKYSVTAKDNRNDITTSNINNYISEYKISKDGGTSYSDYSLGDIWMNQSGKLIFKIKTTVNKYISGVTVQGYDCNIRARGNNIINAIGKSYAAYEVGYVSQFNRYTDEVVTRRSVSRLKEYNLSSVSNFTYNKGASKNSDVTNVNFYAEDGYYYIEIDAKIGSITTNGFIGGNIVISFAEKVYHGGVEISSATSFAVSGNNLNLTPLDVVLVYPQNLGFCDKRVKCLG